MHSHQPVVMLERDFFKWGKQGIYVPFPSFETICTISPVRMDSSFARSLLKSYRTLAVGFREAAGGAEGGGGGGAFMEPLESVRM
jgi:hypothetical protein